MQNKEKTCCFTGHRKLIEKEHIAEKLETEIVALIEAGVLYFGAGGALGFDTLAAQTVLNLRKQYPDIKLILVLPCKTQTYYWDKADIAIYDSIKKEADKIVYLSASYTSECMLARNRHLVDNSAYCICHLTKLKGGTFYTVNYARQKQLKIINVK